MRCFRSCDGRAASPSCYFKEYMSNSPIQWIASAVFAVALLHTFSAKQFERLSNRYPRHAGLFHLLGKVEVVFGFWVIVLIVLMALFAGGRTALDYAEARNFTEPLFVFVVMVIAASRPVLRTVMAAVNCIAHVLPLRTPLATAWLGLAAAPLLGSLITEPAAMTIAALMLAPQIFRKQLPEGVKYVELGVLFVNVSIGGTLTSYAAPPVLMVAATWQWDSAFMFTTFGWKAAIAVLVNATTATFILRKHLNAAAARADEGATEAPVPPSVVAVHLGLLAGVVCSPSGCLPQPVPHVPGIHPGVRAPSKSTHPQGGLAGWRLPCRSSRPRGACSNGGCNPSFPA